MAFGGTGLKENPGFPGFRRIATTSPLSAWRRSPPVARIPHRRREAMGRVLLPQQSAWRRVLPGNSPWLKEAQPRPLLLTGAEDSVFFPVRR